MKRGCGEEEFEVRVYTRIYIYIFEFLPPSVLL